MTMRNFKIALVAFLSLIFVAGCTKEILEVVVNFSQETYELKVGEELDLASELEVKNSSEKPVFVSLDSKTASVSSAGVVNAIAAGEAKIAATVGNKTARCVVKVSDVEAGTISLTCPEELLAGEDSWATVTAQVSAAGFNMDNLEWTIAPSDEALDISYEKVTASEYKVRAKAYVEGGKIVITVNDKNSSASKSAEIEILEPEPEAVPASRISLTYPRSITEGEDVWGKVTAVVTPEEYDIENLEWEVSANKEDLVVRSERLAADEYRVGFDNYVLGGEAVVKVTDKVSGLFMTAVIDVTEKPVGATEISVSPESVVLYTGSEPAALQVLCTPEDYDKALIIWSSDNEEVVTVSGGVLTVVGEGEAVVKAKDSISGLEAECAVTVKAPAADVRIASIVLSQTNLTLKYGDGSVQLVAECFDESGNKVEDYADLVWTAEKAASAVGTVDVVEVSQQGLVTVKNIGNTVLTVSDKNNSAVKATCHVSVSGVLPSGITLSPATLVLPVGMEYDGFQYAISPANCDVTSVIWSSSDNSVAIVDSKGKVTTLSEGNAVITVTTKANNHKAECQLAVKNMAFAISLVLESEWTGGIPQGNTAKIAASYIKDGSEYTPSNTSWASSDPELVTVDQDGNITVSLIEMTEASKTVTITHTADEEEATIDITVVRAHPTGIEVTSYPEDWKMNVGETFNFTAQITPAAADQTVKWTCFNETVSGSWTFIDLETGEFKAEEVGVYTITAFSGYEYRDENGGLHMFDYVRTSHTLEVLPVDAESAELNATELTLTEGNTTSLSVIFTPSNTTYQGLVWSSDNEEVAKVSASGFVTAVADGEATITAYQEENDITLTCKITVVDRVTNYNIGDYYYSDGTISSEIIEGKTIVGVVCSLNDLTGHDSALKADFPACNNGFAISVNEVADVKWQGYGSNISNWAAANGYARLGGAVVQAGAGMANSHVLTSEGEKMHGYNNTKAIKAFMAREDYESLGEDYAVYLLEGWTETAPVGASDWYVPSIAELLAVSENAQTISDKIVEAGGTAISDDGYWTSTENDLVGSFAVCAKVMDNSFLANEQKSVQHKVRYVFAF